MWRFESVHGFGAVGNLYQKMHFAGSNPATDPKCPKCIYKISKNFRVEKSGEISRNLRFSRFFVPASKSDTHHGRSVHNGLAFSVKLLHRKFVVSKCAFIPFQVLQEVFDSANFHAISQNRLHIQVFLFFHSGDRIVHFPRNRN